MTTVRPRLYKRVRRRLWGGKWEMRVYVDGSCRIKVDHPSNDPEIEFAMVGRTYALARQAFTKAGLPAPVIGPVVWRDDP